MTNAPTITPRSGIGSRAPERRREIIEATLEIIHRDGFEGTSMRSVAQRMGTTTGVLTHHFREKSDMLAAAIEEIFDRYQVHIEETLDSPDPGKALISLFSSLLPIDENTIMLADLGLKATSYVRSDDKVGDMYRQKFAPARAGLMNLLIQGQKQGVFRSEFDPEKMGVVLAAMFDGIQYHVLSDTNLFTADYVREIVRTALMPLFVNPSALD